jgi:hypothetical protein
MAVIATPNAARYLAQLVRHWRHKFAVATQGDSAHVPLPRGQADLAAGDMALTVLCTTPDERGHARLQQVIASHLSRLAWREGGLQFTWQHG